MDRSEPADKDQPKQVIRETDDDAIRLARKLIATARHGALAVINRETGFPGASRVALATDIDGTPIILVSALSGHTKPMLDEPRTSLMLGEVGKGDPLAHPRITLFTRARRIERDSDDGRRVRRRFLARQPKAALYAGIKLLMDKMNVDHVDRIGLAGAFGSFIDPKYAMVLGMIPDCDLDQVKAVGNAAGTGARMALLNRGYRREIERTVREIEKIETALEPKFQDHFVAAMALPNKEDPFPQLAKTVTLPERKTLAANDDGRGGGRRRREGGRRARG